MNVASADHELRGICVIHEMSTKFQLDKYLAYFKSNNVQFTKIKSFNLKTQSGLITPITLERLR